MPTPYPLGKLPPDVLAAVLTPFAPRDPRVILGPRPGEDAAVLDLGDRYLVAKTDPITFATDQIGWYAVHVNANDIATTGATPAWFMATLLLPDGSTDRALVERIFQQIGEACDELGISLVGGHTEITHALARPVVVGVMLGLVSKERLITTGGAQPGDALLVTKGVPVEGTAIIAREKADLLRSRFSSAFLARCSNFLHDPGIGVTRDAALATGAGRVHAMHDPTEGGLAVGLWEMAEVAGKRLAVDCSAVVLEEGRALCEAAGLDPLGVIASGALLMAVHPADLSVIKATLEQDGIRVYHIGHVEAGPPAVIDRSSGEQTPLPRPTRDEITKLFES